MSLLLTSHLWKKPLTHPRPHQTHSPPARSEPKAPGLRMPASMRSYPLHFSTAFPVAAAFAAGCQASLARETGFRVANSKARLSRVAHPVSQCLTWAVSSTTVAQEPRQRGSVQSNGITPKTGSPADDWNTLPKVESRSEERPRMAMKQVSETQDPKAAPPPQGTQSSSR